MTAGNCIIPAIKQNFLTVTSDFDWCLYKLRCSIGQSPRPVQVHSESHLRHRLLQPHLLVASLDHDHPLLQSLPGGQATHGEHETEAVQCARHVPHISHPQHLQYWRGDAQQLHLEGGHVSVRPADRSVRGGEGCSWRGEENV